MNRTKMNVPRVQAAKGAAEPLAMITAYDALFAALVDEAGIDMILVGDSVGTVLQGHRTTIPVSMEDMEYHVRMVASVRPKALVVGDLPFGSYQTGPEDAIRNSVRLMKAGAECVKLEGGTHVSDTIRAVVSADIPVMAHIGLTPQSYHRMGGNRIQGRTHGDMAGSHERLVEDALAVEHAGAFAVVIEGVPASLASEITGRLAIPTIGIGAGPSCDGQVLVLHDVLGLSPRKLSFAKPYADLRTLSIDAVGRYAAEVRGRSWPDGEHSFD